MKLLVNADDFGLSKAVNYGILEAFENGVVKSTSLMCNMPAFDHALSISKARPELAVGIHLTLTASRPLTQGLKTLVDENGYFLKQSKLLETIETVDLYEVKTEFTAQIEKALEAGFNITHLDGHHHVHSLGAIPAVTLELCKKYALGCRYIFDGGIKMLETNGIKTTSDFTAGFYSKDATLDYLLTYLKIMKLSPSLEVMCHPAYVDKFLMENSSYNIIRTSELDVLTSKDLKDYVRENNIQLCSYRDL